MKTVVAMFIAFLVFTTIGQGIALIAFGVAHETLDGVSGLLVEPYFYQFLLGLLIIAAVPAVVAVLLNVLLREKSR
jgi:hypothetical protein